MPTTYCDDCGQLVDATGGSFEFFYANKRTNSPSWSPPRNVCGKHKAAREQAGHTARVPGATADPAGIQSDAD